MNGDALSDESGIRFERTNVTDRCASLHREKERERDRERERERERADRATRRRLARINERIHEPRGRETRWKPEENQSNKQKTVNSFG